jgi:hypothetical protein
MANYSSYGASNMHDCLHCLAYGRHDGNVNLIIHIQKTLNFKLKDLYPLTNIQLQIFQTNCLKRMLAIANYIVDVVVGNV